jgi:hypothetical protein
LIPVSKNLLSRDWNGWVSAFKIIKQGVFHINIKKYLKAKEELWNFKDFTMQKYNLQKNPLKETKSFKIS